MNLLDTTNAKAKHGLRSKRLDDDEHYLTGVFYMSPHKSGGAGNVCISAGVCIGPCLNYAGNPAFARNKKKARDERARRWFTGKADLVADLIADIKALERAAVKWSQEPPIQVVKDRWPEFRESRGLSPVRGSDGKPKFSMQNMVRQHGRGAWRDLQATSRLAKGVVYTPAVRLNGTSDLSWEKEGIFERFPHIDFFDYTKRYDRMMRFLDGGMPDNYHLTFSFGGASDLAVPKILGAGGDVTMVFKPGGLPKSFGGDLEYRKLDGSFGVVSIPETRLIDGDQDDLRFLDKVEKKRKGIHKGCIVGLKFKTVTEQGRAAELAAAHDPMRGFVFSKSGRESLSRSNPSGHDTTVAPVAAYRLGCGGTYREIGIDPS